MPMKDLTQDSISGHIIHMAAPAAMTMLTQIAYHLVDLYFVTRIGASATAGVNAAGNSIFLVAALTQVLGVGTAALVAHAAGRNDRVDANRIFNQSIVLAAVSGALTTTLLIAFAPLYLRSVASDGATIDAGITFILWVMPGYAMMFPWTALSSALRGTGVVKPTLVIHMLSVLINAALAPSLIAGYGTGKALGVMGAGLATSLSVIAGLLMLGIYSHRSQRYLSIEPRAMRPDLRQWGRILRIGVPTASEFILTFSSVAIVYYAIRNFGASAQAGFGIGSRVLQVALLPAMSIAFAAGPIAGQNFGANKSHRVKETFRNAAFMATAVMVIITICVQWRPGAFVSLFDADASSLSVAALFLQMMSWVFVAQGMVYLCSTMFQGLGNTVPALISSGTRFVAFAIPTLWLSTRPEFHIEQVWRLSMLSIALQAIVSLCLLHAEFRRRLLPVST